jgi:predicted oxidoreductase
MALILIHWASFGGVLHLDVILLAWILKHTAEILPVCGTADPSRIANLMKATTFEMVLQDWFALWTASAGVPIP